MSVVTPPYLTLLVVLSLATASQLGAVSACTDAQLLGHTATEEEVAAHRQFALPTISRSYEALRR